MPCSGSLAFDQLDSNSITVSVSQSSNVQPDQVVFGVVVQSGLGSNLDDVVAALQGCAITQANFVSVHTNPAVYPYAPTNQLTLLWTFSLSVPFSKQKDSIASLTALEQSIAQGKSGPTLTFSVAGTKVSTPLLQSQTCSITDLFSSAKAQAQKIAAAPGLLWELYWLCPARVPKRSGRG
jgi:hypothetical protein